MILICMITSYDILCFFVISTSEVFTVIDPPIPKLYAVSVYYCRFVRHFRESQVTVGDRTKDPEQGLWGER